MIKVMHARASIRDEIIHHASHESKGVIFAISVVFTKEDDKYELPKISDQWEYHTINSIREKWPTVLPKTWLEQLITQHAIILQGQS